MPSSSPEDYLGPDPDTPAPLSTLSPDRLGQGSDEVFDNTRKVVGGIAGLWGIRHVLTALGTGARPVHTVLAGGGLGQALQSIYDPDKALEWKPFGDDPGWGTVGNALAGAASDPAMFMSFGIAPAGEAALKEAGAARTALLQAGPEASAAERVLAIQHATGGTADAGEALRAGMEANPKFTGLESTFGKQMQAGQRGLQVKIPFTDLKWVPPGAKQLNTVAGYAARGIEAPAEMLNDALVANGPLEGAGKLVKKIYNGLTAPDARETGEAIARDAENKAAAAARPFQAEIGNLFRDARAKGLTDEHLNLIPQYIETFDPATSVPREPGTLLPKNNIEDLAAKADRIRNVVDGATTMTPEARATWYGLTKDIHGVQQRALQSMKDLGVSVDALKAVGGPDAAALMRQDADAEARAVAATKKLEQLKRAAPAPGSLEEDVANAEKPEPASGGAGPGSVPPGEAEEVQTSANSKAQPPDTSPAQDLWKEYYNAEGAAKEDLYPQFAREFGYGKAENTESLNRVQQTVEDLRAGKVKSREDLESLLSGMNEGDVKRVGKLMGMKGTEGPVTAFEHSGAPQYRMPDGTTTTDYKSAIAAMSDDEYEALRNSLPQSERGEAALANKLRVFEQEGSNFAGRKTVTNRIANELGLGTNASGEIDTAHLGSIEKATPTSDTPAPDARTRLPAFEDLSVARMKAAGLSDADVAAARAEGLYAKDNTTGYTEGRFGPARIDTIKRGIKHVGETGQPTTYAHMDLRNLGGLNEHGGEPFGNVVYRKTADLVNSTLREELPDADLHLFRHGGDEMSGVIANATEGEVQAALSKAEAKIQEWAKQTQVPGKDYTLDRIPKKGSTAPNGTGLHYGTSELKPGVTANQAIENAAALMQRRKVGKAVYDYVNGIQSSNARAVAPGESAGGIGQGAQVDNGRVSGEAGDAGVSPYKEAAAHDAGLSGDSARPAQTVQDLEQELASIAEERRGYGVQIELAKQRELATPTFFPHEVTDEAKPKLLAKGKTGKPADAPKGAILSRTPYGANIPELEGVPRSLQSSEKFFNTHGTAATAYDGPLTQNRDLMDSMKRMLSPKGEEEVLRPLEMFENNPQRAMTKYFSQDYYTNVGKAQLARNIASVTNVLDAKPWDQALTDLRAGVPVDEVRDAFKAASGRDLEDYLPASVKSDADLVKYSQADVTHGPAGYRRGQDVGFSLKGKDDVYLPAQYAEFYQRMNDKFNAVKLPDTLNTLGRGLRMIRRFTYDMPQTQLKWDLGDKIRMAANDGVDMVTFRDQAKLLSGLSDPAIRQAVFDDFKDFEPFNKLGPVSLGDKAGVVPMGDAMEMAANEGAAFRGGGYGKQVIDDAAKDGVAGGALNTLDKARAYGRMRDEMNRFTMWATRMRAGDTAAEAAMRTEEALYDYSRMSPAAAMLRNSGLAPGVVWMSKNIPAQVEWALANPGSFAAIVKGYSMLQDSANSGIPEDALPKYMQNRLGIAMSKTKNEQNGHDEWTFSDEAGRTMPQLELAEFATDPIGNAVGSLSAAPDIVSDLKDGKYGAAANRAAGLAGDAYSIPASIVKSLAIPDAKTGDVKTFWSAMRDAALRGKTVDVEEQLKTMERQNYHAVKDARIALNRAMIAGHVQSYDDPAIAGLYQAYQGAVAKQQADARQSQRVRQNLAAAR